MAIVRAPDTFRRYNWMGGDHSETSLENVALMRDAADQARSTRKHRNREQRTRIIREVRCYLDTIKKELQEHDAEAELTGGAKSGLKGDASPEKEEAEASLNLSCLVRGSRYRSGTGLTSYYDGTSHPTIEGLLEYNDHCRKTLQEIIENRKQAASLPEEQKHAELTQQELIQVEEAKTLALPDAASYDLTAEELETLRKPDGEAEDEKKNVRQKYDEKALNCARDLLKFNLVRNANLYGTFRAKQQQPQQQ
jgi:hypothetical protein